MDSTTKKNLGSSLTAASLGVLGLSATLTPLGVSKGVLVAVAVTGGVIGVAGVFFSHLFKNDQAAAVAAGAAIDAGKVPPAGSLVGAIQSNPTVPTIKTP